MSCPLMGEREPFAPSPLPDAPTPAPEPDSQGHTGLAHDKALVWTGRGTCPHFPPLLSLKGTNSYRSRAQF